MKISIVLFVFTILFGIIVLHHLKRFQFGQSIREEGPQSHKKKKGTPTMGGIIFLIPLLFFSLVFLKLDFKLVFILYLLSGFAIIGFMDDFLKIKRKKNLGLTAKQKLIAQVVVTVSSYFILAFHSFDTRIYLTGSSLHVDLSWTYPIFFLLLCIGASNATNLTDGLDGLLAGLMLLSISAYSVIAFTYELSNIHMFSLFAICSILAFLVFNRFPAKVFMGDTGSLALGGLLVGLSIITKTELLLALIGGIYVLETLSVIIQVISFKTRKKRIFKMTPIHHHFELSGWHEKKVVTRFWLAGGALSLIGVLIAV